MSKNVGWQRTAASRCLVLRDRMKIVMGDSAEVFQRQARATPRLTTPLSSRSGAVETRDLLRRVRTVRCRKMSRGETQLHCSDSMPSGLTKMVITVGGQSTPRSCPCCPPRSGCPSLGQIVRSRSGCPSLVRCPPSISSARVPPSPQDDGRHTP